jgi:hypothetical protein
VVSFTPWPLYPQVKSPFYPLDRKLVGPQRRFGRGGQHGQISTIMSPESIYDGDVAVETELEEEEEEEEGGDWS